MPGNTAENTFHTVIALASQELCTIKTETLNSGDTFSQ